ncbi:DUF6626 family protein [Sphingomonas sp. RB1R13]|uniref:DUF6626 family protein n=1 Tax=Sphingomonas sp. RB1R13 TaxID=3096159 RepID=UPI003FA6F910
MRRATIVLNGLYDELKEIGCVRSHGEFSTRFLGRGQRHYDYLRCTRSPASMETLTYLAARLRAVAVAMDSAGTWDAEAKLIQGLCEAVWREVARRNAVVRLPSVNPLRAPTKLF